MRFKRPNNGKMDFESYTSDSRISRYRKTPKGILATIYRSQLTRVAKRGWDKPNYTLEDLYAKYLCDNDYINMRQAWLESGCNRRLKPSIDRINPLVGYVLDNIQMVTWEYNKNKGISELLLTNSTKVIMFTEAGEAIKVFDSIKEAEQETGIRKQYIYRCCSGFRPTAFGYKWSYVGEGRCKNKDYSPLLK